jgi:prepilin-type processing-associated H-X9-DG protein
MRGLFQSETRRTFAEITDGLTHTLMIGEKQVPIDMHGIGAWDCSIYNGGVFPCSARTANRYLLLTTNPRSGSAGFGSRHLGVVMFCFADGRVQALRESTNGLILELLVMRNDGEVIPDY